MTGPRAAWFHCFSGIAGDMALGSLIDAGADLALIERFLEQVPVPGWSLTVDSVLRGGISATRVQVKVADDSIVRTHAHIAALIAEARLPDRVTERSLRTFSLLAQAEAQIHKRHVDTVHFHEVGGHDAIIDIVGTACALEILGIDEVTASAVATGTGTVRAAHGLLPNPAPAVVLLLRGAPTYGRNVPYELTTPTGAAIVAAMGSGFGPLPAMTIESSGFGAGKRDSEDLPNCTQVVVGTRSAASPGDGQPLLILEANLDDATGEQLALAVDQLLAAGAYDAWLSPAVMKKGRPGHLVHALVDPARVDAVRQVMTHYTGTLGVRATPSQRWVSARSLDSVEVDGHRVAMKVTDHRVKAEFDDVSAVARATGRPVQEVASRAEQAWRQWRVVAPPPRIDPDEPEPA